MLVTGAAGFVGRHLVRRLAAEGYTVRAAARDPSAIDRSLGIEPVVLGDLATEIDWRALVSGVSHVVHAAGVAHATSAIPETTYMAVNAAGTRNLAYAARSAGVRRMVLISSVRAQSGACATAELTEQSRAVPDDAYGRSKLAAETQMAAALADGPCDWSVLRPVVVYGPGVKANMRTLQRLALSPLPLPFAGLAGRRSLLGLDTLCDVIAHAMTSPATSRGVFLAADPGPLSVGEMIVAMRTGLGRSGGVFSVPVAPAKLAATMAGKGRAWQQVAGDLVVGTRALEATGWQPQETASQGLARWIREAAAI